MRHQGPGACIRIGLPFSGLVLLAGCAGDGLGEPCGRQADCRNGLLCVEGGCARVASTDTGNVYVEPVTSLEWQQTPTGGALDWESAVIHCQTLELNGSGWRLPNIEELRSLIRGCSASESGGACGATNTCVTYDVCLSACGGCDTDAGPAGGCYWPEELGGTCSWYWTSTALDDRPGAWYVVFDYAHVCGRSPDFNYGLVRCVR